MSSNPLVPVALLAATLGLAACGGGTTDTTTDTTTSTTTSTPASAETGGVPVSMFVSTEPADAGPLLEVKTAAATGDRVTFFARIGGRTDPFIENRAMFYVVDSVLKSCDQLHGDSCKRPWDYCCEPRDNLLKNMATVQIVDDAGAPLKMSLQSQHGLEPLKTIYVTGTVTQKDDAGVFIVNAESIHVKEG